MRQVITQRVSIPIAYGFITRPGNRVARIGPDRLLPECSGITLPIFGMIAGLRARTHPDRKVEGRGLTMGYSAARLLACVMLIAAIGRCTHDYYMLVRVVVCAVSSYGAFLSFRRNQIGWGWCMCTVAFLFNPIFEVRLQRNTWQIVDGVAALFFFASLFFLQETSQQIRWARDRGLLVAVSAAIFVTLASLGYWTIGYILPRWR